MLGAGIKKKKKRKKKAESACALRSPFFSLPPPAQLDHRECKPRPERRLLLYGHAPRRRRPGSARLRELEFRELSPLGALRLALTGTRRVNVL